MRRHLVAGLLRRVATRKQLVQQARQDRRFAAERPTRRFDQVPSSTRIGDVGQRIDIERADDARIQALEIEHPDVAVQTGHRLQHVPALLRGVHT